jgi:nitrogen regulatory protein PII
VNRRDCSDRDGKIFVTPLEEVIRMRTGASGVEAI